MWWMTHSLLCLWMLDTELCDGWPILYSVFGCWTRSYVMDDPFSTLSLDVGHGAMWWMTHSLLSLDVGHGAMWWMTHSLLSLDVGHGAMWWMTRSLLCLWMLDTELCDGWPVLYCVFGCWTRSYVMDDPFSTLSLDVGHGAMWWMTHSLLSLDVGHGAMWWMTHSLLCLWMLDTELCDGWPILYSVFGCWTRSYVMDDPFSTLSLDVGHGAMWWMTHSLLCLWMLDTELCDGWPILYCVFGCWTQSYVMDDPFSTLSLDVGHGAMWWMTHSLLCLWMLDTELCDGWPILYSVFGCWTRSYVMDDPFSTLSLQWLTLFSVLAVVILANSSLHGLIISVVESECHGVKKWQRQSLEWWSHHFLGKSSPGCNSEVISCKTNIFIYRPHRKKGWWVYWRKKYSCWDLHFQTLKELDIFIFLLFYFLHVFCCWFWLRGEGLSFSDQENIFSLSLSLSL